MKTFREMSDAEKFENAREEFLNALADCEWQIDYDADTDSNGHQVDCSTFSIQGSISCLAQMCSALGIEPKLEQSLESAIEEAMEN